MKIGQKQVQEQFSGQQKKNLKAAIIAAKH